MQFVLSADSEEEATTKTPKSARNMPNINELAIGRTNKILDNSGEISPAGPRAESVYRRLTEKISRTRKNIGTRLKSRLIRLRTLKHNASIRCRAERPRWCFRFVTNGTIFFKGWGVDLATLSAAGVRIKIGRAVHFPQARRRADVRTAFSSIANFPERVGFSASIPVPSGLHRFKVQIASDRKWIQIKKGWVLNVALIRPHKEKLYCPDQASYREWVRFEQATLREELDEIRQHTSVMIYKPRFTIVVDVRNVREGLGRTLKSIRQQIYPHYDLCFLGEHDTVARQAHTITHFGHVSGDFIVLVESSQMLAVNALYEFANALNLSPDADIIYGDEDISDESGRRTNPFYKPDWSPDYIETFNYIGFPTCVRTSIVPCDTSASWYDLILRLTERTSKVMHIQKILGHSLDLQRCGSKTRDAAEADTRALQGRLIRTGRSGTVREHPLHKGCYDIQLVLKATPLVSVIIPTAAKVITAGNRRVDLLANVVDHLINRSSYKNIEIIVVDNGDLMPERCQPLTRQGCKFVSYRESQFNFSKKLNLGSMLATGDLLLLMNDDIEVVTSSWMERLIEHFEKPHVGVVGARLLYPDGRIQHAGVVHNFGIPDHVRRFSSGDEAGYFFSTCGVRNFSAVTGAVMMVRSSVFREVGGYSEELAVSYNDIDFCLKVRERGLSVVYAPEAKLNHMESVSRASRLDWMEQQWYRERWSTQIAPDRFYNERFLSLAPATFEPVVNRRRF